MIIASANSILNAAHPWPRRMIGLPYYFLSYLRHAFSPERVEAIMRTNFGLPITVFPGHI
jgi:hypothetical protein